MPLYEYECPACGHRFDQLKSFSQAGDIEPCPLCKAPTVRIIAPANFQLTGEGWAKDNYGVRAREQGKLK